MVVVNAVLLALLILVQTRGASIGAGFGGGGEINTVRRGSDRTLHQLTVLLVASFVMAIIASIIVA
jgi:preprotein translocase subunit SecG